MSALVEELRSVQQTRRGGEAADEIERLQRENDILRVLLRFVGVETITLRIMEALDL